MKLVRKTLVLWLAVVLVLTTIGPIASAMAEVGDDKKLSINNDFIKVTVDEGTGRFGIRTKDGQPIRKNDQNVDMLFKGDDPETSFTTFRIDGTDYIFGNPYKFGADFFSEIITSRVVPHSDGSRQIESTWKIKGVEITQILKLYPEWDKLNSGNVNIRYLVVNRSGAQVELGSRVLLDTMVGGNDGPQFQIGTIYKQPLMVERKLIHNPEDYPEEISEEDRAFYKLPPYWVMRDTFNPTNPLATNVVAYGFNNFSENNINIVDEMIVGHWNGLANTKWDYTPNKNLDFTRNTNDYGTADSAVAFYWNPETLEPDRNQSFETVYGLGELVEPDKVFSIRYMDTPQQLSTLEDNTGYTDEGIFDITAEVENLAVFGMEHSRMEVEMKLDSGLSFVKLDETGNIVRDGNGKVETEAFNSKVLEFRKTATPEEAAHGIQPKFKPGETITASFKVQANGKPWPTTKEYMLAVRSPETQRKIEGIEDEGIKAQYESNKANFILLPAVGQATATYSYGLSPDELYSTDEKYITVNLSNIEAYNTGNETSEPNFDLYIKETVTGERYKVPVKESVLLQPTDDGATGDMRITYRGGDKVDEEGNVLEAGVGPELPLGEYQVEIDYKEDTEEDPGTDEEEIAALYDITTPQTFLVTDNEESRIREANILAIYKQPVDLQHVPVIPDQDYLDEMNELFQGEPFKKGDDFFNAIATYKETKTYVGMASKAVDPEFDLSEYLDDEALAEVPIYQYELFESDEELEEFFEDEEHEDFEQLVVIRGMIKQVGTEEDQQVIVDTSTEPAIINDSVAYKGKDMAFVRGKLDIFNSAQEVDGYDSMPFFDSLFVKGDGTLSVASSGFVFHEGEWTLDFYNGFDKTLGEGYVIEEEMFPDSEGNEEDESLNGSLSWAVGMLGDRLNPMRQLMIDHVYFNKQSLFSGSMFSFDGFGITFNDFILRPGGISFGGKISLKVVEAEVRNVVFNDIGFVGIDASLRFDLNEELGLFGPAEEKKEDTGGGAAGDTSGAAEEPEEPSKPKGEIYVQHYVQDLDDLPPNRYGVKFAAQLKNMLEIQAELSLKKVKDGRILPDVIAFGAALPAPGILITGATYLQGIRGAVRELADTIAGGTDEDPFPLVIQAGVDLRFGISPAYHFGEIDLTVKRTGMALEGALSFSTVPEPKDDELLPMLTHALLEAQWVTPWFVRLEAEVDIGGWDLIIGKAGIFVGQNLEKHRIDFEGYIGAKVQIPGDVPVVGGMPLSSVFFGVNNEKIWGSIGILFISLGITYYWGGGVEFGTSSEQLPDGLIHLVVQDPERGPRLMVIGQGLETVATSWLDAEQDTHEIAYRNVGDGVTVLDNGTMSVGIGGIAVKNGGRIHEIPMAGVTGNAIVEMEYFDETIPAFTLKDPNGKLYPVVFDNTNSNPNANAFTQHIPAGDSTGGVDVRKAYIILPQEETKNGGTWTLAAESAVETRLINVPTVPGLTDVQLEKNSGEPNKLTASWTVRDAKAGDTVNLYLTKDAVSGGTTTLENGQEVLEPGEPGMLISKDLAVDANGAVNGNLTNGSAVIDVTQVSMLGDKEDIRGLLQQGEYYLRAELKSDAAFGTKTAAGKFEIIDPLAPNEVTDVVIEPAGNGNFELSFKPAEKKAGLGEETGYSYKIEALKDQGGKLDAYPNFGELLFTKKDLEKYWNPDTGRYEGIIVGGWTAVTTSDEINTASLDGTALWTDSANAKKFIGLEVGKEYVIGVTAVTKPPKMLDKNENYHFAGRVDSEQKLLPVPVKPDLNVKLNPADKNVIKPYTADKPFIELLTNQTEQSIELASKQQDIEVEAFYSGESVGKVTLDNDANGSSGTLRLDRFKTDGPYAIELKARNTRTKDVSVTMLYLTVDTIRPVLYLDEPVTGDRTKDGKIRVSGTTSKDAVLSVNGVNFTVAENGSFSGEISVPADKPTAAVQIMAHDLAGNENSAAVDITNDQYKVPVGLVLRKMAAIKPDDRTEHQIEAFLRYPDGKDPEGKAKFMEIAVPVGDDRLEYFILTGEAVSLAKSGIVTAAGPGANVIQGKYRISDDVSLESVMALSVEGLESISASTEEIWGDMARTKVNIGNAGDLQGYQLAYKVYPAGETDVNLPAYKDDLKDWSILPSDRKVPAKQGDTVVIAKRTTGSKKAMGVSGKLTAKVSTVSGGFFGGLILIPPVKNPSGVTVNGNSVESDIAEDTLTAHITAQDIDSASADDIVIASDDRSVKGYTLRVDQTAARKAAGLGKKIMIDMPTAQMELTSDMLAGVDKDLEIKISPNSDEAQDSRKSIAESVDASLLGEGQGVTVVTNIDSARWSSYLRTKIRIPDAVRTSEITAIVLQGPDGNWTTVPWRLDVVENEAYADVQLTGEGSLIFVRNTTSFTDVEQGFWGKSSIDEAASKLFVLGKGEGRFDPESLVSRAEYPTILLRVAGMMNKSGETSFADVGEQDWFNRSVAIAADLGIVNGFEDGTFAPNAKLSRVEAMTMIGRLLQTMELSEDIPDEEANRILSSFKDKDLIPAWAKKPVALSIKKGVIEGEGELVNPLEALTRAQAAAMAVRLDNLMKN